VSSFGDGVRLVVEGAPSFVRGQRRLVLGAWLVASLVVGGAGGALSARGLDVPATVSSVALASVAAALALKIVLAVFSRRDRRAVGEHWSVPPASVTTQERQALEASRPDEPSRDLERGVGDVAERAERLAVYERRRLVPVVLGAPFIVALLALTVVLVTLTLGEGGASRWTLVAPLYFSVTAAIGLVADTRRLGRTVSLVSAREPAYRIPGAEADDDVRPGAARARSAVPEA
jgi:hypothetical protein